MRRLLLVGALIAASLGGLGAGNASAVCDPDYRPLCASDCPGPLLPDPRDPTNTSWLIRMGPDGTTAARTTHGCGTTDTLQCVALCANVRQDPNAPETWPGRILACLT